VSCWTKVFAGPAAWEATSIPPLAVYRGPATSVVGLAIVGFAVLGLAGTDQETFWNTLQAGPDAWLPLDNATAALCPTSTSALADVAIADAAICDTNPEGVLA
jgi:hypothetical protein